MRSIIGDLWDTSDDSAILIPTCGIVQYGASGDRRLVMGAGVAHDAVKRTTPQLQRRWGNHVNAHGNVPSIYEWRPLLVSFPTKHDWRNKSDSQLIEKSARIIAAMSALKDCPEIRFPAVGCGLGGLRLDFVLPILERYFTDDRFVLVLQEEP